MVPYPLQKLKLWEEYIKVQAIVFDADRRNQEINQRSQTVKELQNDLKEREENIIAMCEIPVRKMVKAYKKLKE